MQIYQKSWLKISKHYYLTEKGSLRPTANRPLYHHPHHLSIGKNAQKIGRFFSKSAKIISFFTFLPYLSLLDEVDFKLFSVDFNQNQLIFSYNSDIFTLNTLTSV